MATANIRGGPIVRHGQAMANAIQAATGANSFGTYNGHDPTRDRAIDIFVAQASYNSDRRLGDEVAKFIIRNLDKYGGWYLIWRQRIYNPSVAERWRDMPSRGGPVQDHYDHIHLSFYATAPNFEEDDLAGEADKILEELAALKADLHHALKMLEENKRAFGTDKGESIKLYHAIDGDLAKHVKGGE